MKGMICVLVLMGLLLSTGICFAQGLSGWEWDAYYDLIDSIYREGTAEDHLNEIANKYGISVETVQDIESRGLESREPTDREWEIYEYLFDQ